MTLKITAHLNTMTTLRTKGIIPLFFAALSISFWSLPGIADEETASPANPGVISFRLNSLSPAKAVPSAPETDAGTSATTAQRSPRVPKRESFKLSANASTADSGITETSAERKPLEVKSQTLRLSSRSPGIEFRGHKKTANPPASQKTRGPIATLLNNVAPQESPATRLGDSVSPGLFKGHGKRNHQRSRLEEPSKLDQSPFRVESKSDLGESHDGHSLGLSEEVIPFTEYGLDLTKRKKTLTEVIEDKHFPENIERLEQIAERPLDDVDMEIPERKTLFGNDRFLSPGPIDKGVTVPSGATWRPSFMLFGDLRTGIQSYESAGGGRINEWANRLDIYGNLTLTSTERLLIGFRPLDEDGIYTGVAGGSGLRKDGFQNGLDLEPHTFFFEGYLDELFPFLDPDDFKGNDYGFSFGRQPFSLQDGIMANDDIDAFAITKHNMFLLGSSNARVSAWFGFNEINRGDNLRDSSARLFALDGAFDYPKNTIEADIAYVDGSSGHGGDGLYFGLGHITQLGYWNSTFRVNRSFAMNRNTAAIDDGWLLTHQLGRAMRQSEDIFTMSSFAEFGNYTSVARGPENGGSLGGFSLLHRAVGLGHYGSALSEESGDQAGQIFSYQHYLDEDAQSQLLYAAGYSAGFDDNTGPDFTAALGIQYQKNVFTHTVWRIGGFGTITDEGDKGFGIRTELQRKF
ncbi:MAG: hypothetical protein P1U86_09505 [Verrucomicrobiales bacterium]|nr:hypothetical protein [Verrucomicrobiales bacterium]